MDNLLRQLQHSWRHDGTTAEARAALARWSEHHPGLARYDSPLELVDACHSRSDPDAQGLVEAIAEHAPTDPLATRTVLQALLPRLGVARQQRDLIGDGREPFSCGRDLDQFIDARSFHALIRPTLAARRSSQ